MGLPPPKAGEEKTARAGATFDPKNFKGNAMLFRHLNEVSLSKCRQKFEASAATQLKKNARKKMEPPKEVAAEEPGEEPPEEEVANVQIRKDEMYSAQS